MGSILSEKSSAQSDIIGYTPIDKNTGKAVSGIPSYESYATLKSGEDPYKGYSKPRDTSKGSIDNTEYGDIKQVDYTAKSVLHYANAVAGVLKGGADIANGYLSKMSAQSRQYTYEFQADQNKKASDVLLKNQIDITRAAQMDSNRYRIAGAETKAKQKTGMAATGFAVGKGVYKNTLSTTDARVNYNVANLMLKSELENAEITRKAGALRAQAIVDEANAKIAKKEGEFAVLNGWISGISNFISAGASFYIGGVYNGDFGVKKKTDTNTNKTTKGK